MILHGISALAARVRGPNLLGETLTGAECAEVGAEVGAD